MRKGRRKKGGGKEEEREEGKKKEYGRHDRKDFGCFTERQQWTKVPVRKSFAFNKTSWK